MSVTDAKLFSPNIFFPLLCLCISSLLMSLRLSSTKNAHMITWRPLTAIRTWRLSWAVCVAVRFQNRSFPQATRCTYASSPMPQCKGKAFRPLIPLVTTLSFLCLMLRCIFWLFACIRSDVIQVFTQAILMSCWQFNRPLLWTITALHVD